MRHLSKLMSTIKTKYEGGNQHFNYIEAIPRTVHGSILTQINILCSLQLASANEIIHVLPTKPW